MKPVTQNPHAPGHFNPLRTRNIRPELLDALPQNHPEAQRSRVDLQRVNRWMGNHRILAQTLHKLRKPNGSWRLAELGAGDGTLMLRIAESKFWAGQRAHLTLIDRQGLLTDSTRARFARVGWSVETAEADVFEWLEQQAEASFDLLFANLFLHHFTEMQLRRLFSLAGKLGTALVACEPRRCRLGLFGAYALPLIGCNRVTRHDAVVSVRAGFAAEELSQLWPDHTAWRCEERRAGWFSHLFCAQRLRKS